MKKIMELQGNNYSFYHRGKALDNIREVGFLGSKELVGKVTKFSTVSERITWTVVISTIDKLLSHSPTSQSSAEETQIVW